MRNKLIRVGICSGSIESDKVYKDRAELALVSLTHT